MRIARSLLAASAAAVLLATVVATPAVASPAGPPPISPITPTPVPGGPWIIDDLFVPAATFPSCKGLLAPGATSLFGVTPRFVGELANPATHTGYGTGFTDVQAIIQANGGRSCTWTVRGIQVTLSVTAISENNRRAIDARWWTAWGVDGYNTGGRSTLYTHTGTTTESGYLQDEPLYLTATSADGTYFPAFVQLESDWLYSLRH
jgi:hypothetical protein